MSTFDEAKLRYNPDPEWWPTRGSKEYKEILELMRQSGHITLLDRLARPVRTIAHTECIEHGNYRNPLNRHVCDPEKPKISKRDFLGVTSNKNAVEEHVMANAAPVISMSRPEIGEAPPLPCIECDMKRMSKQDFLKLKGVKEYVDHHILLNKK